MMDQLTRITVATLTLFSFLFLLSSMRPLHGSSGPEDELAIEAASSSQKNVFDSRQAHLGTTNTYEPAIDLAGHPVSIPQHALNCFRGKWKPARCPDDNRFFIPWMKLRPKSNWTLVNVGANKGYLIADWLHMLSGNTHKDREFSSLKLGMHIFPYAPPSVPLVELCGGCCDCLEYPAKIPPTIQAETLRIFAYEPLGANYVWLSQFFQNVSDIVAVFHMGVGSKESTAYIPLLEFGAEIGKLFFWQRKRTEPVQVVSLDHHLGQQRGVQYIDVLVSDAEGLDAEVFSGAQNYFRSGRVGVFLSELSKGSGRAFFDKLDLWGYNCYFWADRKLEFKLGKKYEGPPVPRFVPITGCWNEWFEHAAGWINMICYSRRNADLVAVFDEIDQGYTTKFGGKCQSRLEQRTKVVKWMKRFGVQRPRQNNSDNGHGGTKTNGLGSQDEE